MNMKIPKKKKEKKENTKIIDNAQAQTWISSQST